MSLLLVLEHLLSSRSLGSAVKTSVAGLGAALGHLVHALLVAPDHHQPALDALQRVFAAASGNKDAAAHAWLLSLTSLQLVASCAQSKATKQSVVEAVGAGVTLLLGRCGARQRRQLHGLLSADGKALYGDLAPLLRTFTV